MTKEETKRMLEYIKNSYIVQFKNVYIDDSMVSLWHNTFCGFTRPLVGKALLSYTKTHEFPPTISGLMSAIEEYARPLVVKYKAYLRQQENIYIPERCNACQIALDDGFDLQMCSGGSYCYKVMLAYKMQNNDYISSEEAKDIEMILGEDYIKNNC